MKSGFVDKLIQRVDRVEPGEVQQYLNRLVQEKGFFEKIFEALREGVIVADGDGTILYINRSAGAFFGAQAEAATGKSIGDIVRGMDWSALVSTRATVNRDMEVFYPENRILNFYITPLPLVDDDEPADGDIAYVMLVRDATENRRHTEEKIESERLNALTMLAAGVAHEIGNPLNSLNIHLQLLERKVKKAVPDLYKETLKEYFEIGTSEVKRLDFIVDQFLRAIRPSEPQFKMTNVNELVEESCRFLEPELKDREIRVTLDLAEGVPLLKIDPDQLKQAFYNLIRNASQAIGADGDILVRSDLDDDFVEIHFVDTGGGIPAEAMGQIFDPYFTTKKTGSGLGLLIVRRIIREHGGEIRFESKEGEGTKVTVFLPRYEKNVRMLKD
ncbi:MAG: ATP-binding protein [Verrucomicrobiota bacterium]